MTKCEWVESVPGPHPGCAEFAPHEEITCDELATCVVTGDDPWGGIEAASCELHATQTSAWLNGTATITPIDEWLCTYCGTFGHTLTLCDQRPLTDEELHYMRSVER